MPHISKNKAKTLKDVAKAAGLSLITVSRVFREPNKVQAATRKKVFDVVEEIGYVPNLNARSMVSNRSNIIGVVVPMLANSLFADFTQSLAKVFREEKLQMLLGVSDWSMEQEAEVVKTLIGRQVDAIIVTGFSHSDYCQKMLSAFNGPVIETWNIKDSLIDTAVGIDNQAAAYDMTGYLIEKGYQDIAVVGSDIKNNDQLNDRYQGFLSKMKEAGLPVRDDFITSIPLPATLKSGWNVMMRLIKSDPRPDAVFFLSEIPAHGAIMACMSHGIKIPETVAIAGYGDNKLSSMLPVPMTTIKIKAKEIGEVTARLVVDRLNGLEDRQKIHDIGYELIIREST
jgi:LacI family transcriptional regulator, gluconate utilization system Gnt-I transcriptional repressor